MKRLFLGVTVLCGGALLGGCPVYSNDRYCNDTGCYDCPSGTTPSNGTCIQWACSSSNDCDPGYVCDPNDQCVLASGPDAGCGPCPSGFFCKLSGGVAQCAPGGGVDAALDVTAPDAGRVDGAVDGAVDARADTSDAFVADGQTDSPVIVSDAPVATDVAAVDASRAPDVVSAPACNGNAACGLDGSKCIDGRCAPVSQLCSDTTQCVVAGEACVDGVCVPHCSPSSPCPAGYACDFTRGVCDLNPNPCSGSETSTCIGGSICVEGRCVAPCAPSDTGSACPGAQLCINGGCIPDEAASFACKNDGQSGLLANECTSADICLHHDCYPACDPDGGTCADPAASCKQVTVTEGTYAVCATPSSLGSDCDPAIGKYCLSGVCIDGYCK